MKSIYNQTSTKELVIIDPRVESFQILTAGVRNGAKVIIIDPNFDGIEQITAALTEHPANSLHIVCHGAPGCLYLGKTAINAANIHQYRQQLQQWKVSDILLYACNVAADPFLKKPGFSQKPGFWWPEDPNTTRLGFKPDDTTRLGFKPDDTTRLGFKPQANSSSPLKWTKSDSSVHFSGLQLLARKLISGRALLVTQNPNANFLKQLHHLTGANIAASAHPVGNTSKGGTWNLEYKLGNITSTLAFSPEVCSSYPGIFPASFATPTNFAVGGSPYSVTTGDFNGDGKLDIAAVNRTDNNVSVLLGTGTGSFGAATNFATGGAGAPVFVTTRDFNGDGKLDIAVANNNVNDFTVLIGDGTGSFGTPTAFTQGYGPRSLATGDFNGDGKLDIAAVNNNASSFSVFIGNGSGSFGAATNFSVGSGPYSITTADFNGDGKLDIAVANAVYSNVNVLIGNGSGSFGAATNFAVGGNAYSVTTGDFNGDGKLDLATANKNSSNVSVLIGNGSGSFGAATNLGVGGKPFSVTTGDFNGDGILDIATANGIASNVSVLIGNGDGTFGTATDLAVGFYPISVRTGDFNGDGKLDIAAANLLDGNVSLLLNTFPTVTIAAGTAPSESGPTNGTFTITLDKPAPTGGLTVNFDTTGGSATFTTDYSFDLATSANITAVTATSFTIAAGQTTATLSVKPVDDAVIETGGETVQVNLTASPNDYILGPTSGASVEFSAATDFAVGAYPTSVTVADFNGDGKTDLAVANFDDNNVSVLLGTGTGSFGAATNFSMGSGPQSVTVGDFNGDGKIDLAVANVNSNNVSVRLGTGTGSFSAATNFGVGTGPFSVTVGDFNGDGIPDLVAANSNSNNVSVRLGTGTGSFGAATNFAVGGNLLSVTVADFNGDGKSDIATANGGSNNVSVRLGTGTGSFGAATNFAVGGNPISVTVGDFNGDGKTDIAAANYNDYNVSVLLGTGTGSFGAANNFDVGGNPQSVTVGDFNGDGKTDLATANYSSNNVSVLLGTGTGSFGAATNFDVGSEPYSIAVGDFNGDGKTDIAAANYYDYTVSVLLNNNLPTSTLTIADNVSPTVTIAAGTAPSESGPTNGTFTITLNNPAPTGGLTVNFTPGGTATNTTDYSITTGTNITAVTSTSFTIAAGQTEAVLNVTPVDDTIIDPGETVQLTLNNGTGYIVGAANNASLTITDDDPVISMTAGTAPSESGPTNGIFNISLNTASATPITVNFNTTDSTATVTTDYSFDLAASTGITAITANSFTIAAGVTSATLVVKPVDDAEIEAGGETVQLNLLSGTGYTLNATTATNTFAAATNFDVGANPVSVTTGDFNDDGIPDLAAANWLSSKVSVVLGDGTGSFGAATNFAVGGNPFSVTVGDFNGDGIPDIAVANVSSNNVSVLLGTGTGSFGAASNFAAGSKPRSVTVGDFNGDGFSDLAAANNDSNDISVLLGDGTGSFGAATNFAAGTYPFSVTVGDFNGDGKSDLATANKNSNDVSVLLGDGTGSFGAATNFAVGTGSRSVTVGDFNGDGKTDLAAANLYSSDVSVLLGDGTGSFGAATNFAVGSAPFSVTVGDFNGDGKSDIATANLYSSNVSVLLGDGTGSFGAATNLAAGSFPTSVTVGDFNGDGKTDIAAANYFSNNISLLLNQQQLTVTQTIADNDPVTVEFSAATYQVNEDGTTSAAITINRVGDAANPGSVDVQFTDVTAIGGTDFTNATQTINFAANETSKTVTIPITDDILAEGNEDLTLTLANPSANFVLGTQTTSTITIVDNDTDVTLAIAPSSVTEDGANNLVYTFTRAGVTTNALTVNFNVGGTATYNTDYTVSGANTFNGSNGTITFAANSTTATVTIDPTADTTVELDETVDLTLAAGSNYNVVTNTPVTGTITNDDAAVDFSQANYQINEDGTVIGATVTINRTGVVNTAGNVQVQFANGSATGGTDFTNTTQTINFAANETSKTVTIPINDDNLAEGTENFTISLVNPSSGISIGTQNTATVQIIDNDVPPSLAISDIAQSEGNSGTTNFNFTVSLNTPIGLPVTVNYATQNSTATTGDSDYNSTSGSLTFAPGETQKTVSVTVNGDPKFESDETFEVKLTNPTNATITDDTGVGTITNDDALPGISISNATAQNEGNSGTVNHSFNVSLSNVSSQTISVNYNTADVTATTADSDYANTSGNLIFNPGETQKTINVISNGDNKYENTETFNLNLSTPINTTITNGTGVGTINNDDSLPTIAIADVSQNEGQSGITNFIFPVTLSNPTYQTVTVNYATANGISIAGTDYNSTSGSLTFNPGEIQKNITVGVIGNTTVETNKNFLVNLSNLSNAALADNQAVGTILNDDSVLVNNAPFVNAAIPSQTSNANNLFNFSFAADTFKDIDVGDTLTYSATLINGNALPNWLFFNSFTRTFVGTPGSDVGPIVLTVKATDSANASATTSFALAVNGSTLPQPLDPNCFCDRFVRADINNLPGVSLVLNPLTTTQSGTESDDILLGSNDNDALYGNGRNDLLLGYAGKDNLIGDKGNDTAFGGIGNDWIAGNEGDDVINGNEGDDVINGNEGNDLVRGGQGNDLVRGGQNDDLLFGDDGNDTLGGDQGNDTIFGDTNDTSNNSGRDLIFGGSGDDLINGNAANDTIFGEDGNDTVRGGKDDDILFGDAGNDLLYGDLGNDSLCGGDGNDTMYGGNGSPTSSNGDRDELCGGAGNDLLFGNEGNDKLNADEGDDSLYGGKDNDTLIGGAGNDFLSGDLGNDLLTGGSGSDRFILTSSAGSDTITDFQDGQDLIVLGGGLSFGQLAIVQSSNNTIVSVKSSNELLATLNGIQVSLITQQDFVSGLIS